MKSAASLLAGLLFGFGLALAGMTDPAKIIGFLDFSGRWDPTLALVLGGAVLITTISFRLILRRPMPLLGGEFHLPSRRDIDARLLAGAAIFGIGWGLAGFCPGPGVAAMALGTWPPVIFTAGLVVGMLLFRYGPRSLHPPHP